MPVFSLSLVERSTSPSGKHVMIQSQQLLTCQRDNAFCKHALTSLPAAQISFLQFFDVLKEVVPNLSRRAYSPSARNS